jgi:cysteine desulfurase
MHVNNEIGTIQPIDEIGKICKENKVIFFIPMPVKSFGKFLSTFDIGFKLTIKAHKIYGPKGVGALYIKKEVIHKSFIACGGQEFGLRSSTENTPGHRRFC